MAYYAELDEDNVVLRVNVVNDDYEPTEAEGIAWCESFWGGRWIKTSYNAAFNGFRGQYAGIGDVYDPVEDKFYTPIEP